MLMMNAGTPIEVAEEKIKALIESTQHLTTQEISENLFFSF